MNSKLRNILMDFDTWCLCGKDECVLSENFKEAEKAIRQAVGEEMLELVGDLEPEEIRNVPRDMPVNYAALEMKLIKIRTKNDFRAELRQKIKQWVALKEQN